MSACPKRIEADDAAPSLRVVCDGPVRLTAASVLDDDYLAIPLLAMQELGPASQTLAAFLRIATRETFRALEAIAEVACLDKRTVQRHLQILTAGDRWLRRVGRGKTNKGRPRRTVTYAITPLAREAKTKYAMLARWVAARLETWAERAVFALVVSRHHFVENKADDPANAGIKEYEGYPLKKLIENSGLSRASVCKAKRSLIEAGWIEPDRGSCRHGKADVLRLNSEFEVQPEWFITRV